MNAKSIGELSLGSRILRPNLIKKAKKVCSGMDDGTETASLDALS